ncbi:ATP-binding protein [Candidatus Woesearchaeota archaeon]|nr:ATP-binding protein [Candidatus Woesearchaeota archaeon]
MYIRRALERTLNKYLSTKEIIAVVGPRQSGKTTLLQNIFKQLQKANFLTFEDRETLELFNEDIQSFIDIHVKPYTYLFIDEFQYAREGGKQLKYIYDTQKTKIIISGSSVIDLTIHSIKYLVGRIFVFHLYPCSFEEFLLYKEPVLYNIYSKRKLTLPIIKKIFPLFQQFCIYGGYPRVILGATKEEKEIVLKNIYNTYFLKEIKEILNIKEDYKIEKLLHALALQTGNIINYDELGVISALHHLELLDNMNVLEKTFICLRATPFHTNPRTELVKSPKIFFYDNGFRNTVIKNFQTIETRTDKGALYENFIASELIKQERKVQYWRTKSKAEVDFIIEQAVPLEIKSTLTAPQTTKSFQSFLEKYRPKKSIILSEKLSAKRDGIIYEPIFSIEKIIRKL